MNRADFIKEVAKRNKMNQRQAYRAVIAVMDTLRIVMAQGDSVEIGGFGVFKPEYISSRDEAKAFVTGRVLERVVHTAERIYKP